VRRTQWSPVAIGIEPSEHASKRVHFGRVLRFVFAPLALAVPYGARAQQPEAPPSLPPLPPPDAEPAPAVPSTPAPTEPPPATPPPARVASPSSSADVPEGEPAETTPVLTLGDIPKLLVASVGLGYSFANQRTGNDPSGRGFYASAEFVLVPNMWVSPRLYGGLLLTSTDSSTCGGASPCDVEAKIGFLGAKGRLTIPIPYVAPFFELGVGMSAGTLATRTDSTDKNFAGVTYHIPFALGLSFGEMHHYFVDLALSYLFHPDQSQFEGALALSLAFRLK
jgi:hypothetical protein